MTDAPVIPEYVEMVFNYYKIAITQFDAKIVLITEMEKWVNEMSEQGYTSPEMVSNSFAHTITVRMRKESK